MRGLILTAPKVEEKPMMHTKMSRLVFSLFRALAILLVLFFLRTLTSLPASAQSTIWDEYVSQGQKAFDQGNYAEAEKFWGASLQESLKYDVKDERRRASIIYVGTVYRKEGKYADAELVFTKYVEFVEKILGHDDPEVADALTYLSRVYVDEGKRPEAEPPYRRALAIRNKKTFGATNAKIATA